NHLAPPPVAAGEHGAQAANPSSASSPPGSPAGRGRDSGDRPRTGRPTDPLPPAPPAIAWSRTPQQVERNKQPGHRGASSSPDPPDKRQRLGEMAPPPCGRHQATT